MSNNKRLAIILISVVVFEFSSVVGFMFIYIGYMESIKPTAWIDSTTFIPKGIALSVLAVASFVVLAITAFKSYRQAMSEKGEG